MWSEKAEGPSIPVRAENLPFYSIILFADSWAQSLIAFLRGLGIAGPFLLEALDGSFLYLPFASEVLLFISVRANREGFAWVIYVIMAALGTMTGVMLLDLLMRKIGEESLERYVKPKKLKRLKSKLQSNAGWSLFIASLMPPGFPFKLVVITASALQSPRRQMFIAVFSGRLIRFGCEAVLFLYFGHAFLNYLGSEMAEYMVIGLIIVAVTGSLLFIYKVSISR